MKPIREQLPNRAGPGQHLDEVRFVVRLTGSPIEDPETTTGGLFSVWSGPLAVSLEDAARYASAVAWDEEREIFEPFVSNQRYRQFEWGASGLALEFAIEVFNSVAAETVMLGMGYAIGKIRGRKTDSSVESLRTAEGLAEVMGNATAAIFEVDREEIVVSEIEVKRRTATVVMKSADRRFHASVRRLDTNDPVVVIMRED